MVTSDGDRPTFDRIMAAATGLPEPTWGGPGDLSRASAEAMVARSGDVRDQRSRGSVRLTGAGVRGHAADLDGIGQVATSWQRVVTAVGAALEGSTSAFGRISSVVEARTKLSLQAAPAPGSILLNVSPAADAQLEAAPGGVRPMFDPERPLADRANEALLALLSRAASTDLVETDELAAELKELGPRVATALRRFTSVTAAEHFDVELEWAEPAAPTRRASMSAGTAGWLSDFVAGRDLDATEEELTGVVRTVSDIAKWSIDTETGNVQVDAAELEGDVVHQTRVGDTIRLMVLVRTTERPDGTSRRTTKAVRRLPLPGATPFLRD